MGISSALYTGVSGLNTNGNAMSVIGNNIANTNTVGFKSSRTVFADLLSATISGSGGTSQVGRGTQLSIVDNVFSQGTFENTESGTDLAIEGESFFVVKPVGSEQNYYTRAGAFRFNENGYLVNPEGFHVQGKGFLADGTLSIGDPSDIKVDIGTLIPAKMSANINLTTNLDANAIEIPGGFDPLNPSESSGYATSTRIFDSLGNTHLITTYFTKVGANAWEWNSVTNASDLRAVNDGRQDIESAGANSIATAVALADQAAQDATIAAATAAASAAAAAATPEAVALAAAQADTVAKQAAYDAAADALAADPTNPALIAAEATAQTDLTTAQATEATAQGAYDATPQAITAAADAAASTTAANAAAAAAAAVSSAAPVITAMTEELNLNDFLGTGIGIWPDFNSAETGLANAQSAYDNGPSQVTLDALNTAKKTYYYQKYRMEAAQGSLGAAQAYAADNSNDALGTIAAALNATSPSLVTVGNGSLVFDSDGKLIDGDTGGTYFGSLDWENSSSVQDLAFNFNMTQFRSDSIVISQGQDGYAAGSLVKIAIDGNGIVTANYSNGERIKVSQIALAKFPNTGGLLKDGSNLYVASDTSGDPRVGVPGSELGKIFTNALEQSNVDLAQEFVKMITTQRGFQANSKIITTTDELLGELINLKR